VVGTKFGHGVTTIYTEIGTRKLNQAEPPRPVFAHQLVVLSTWAAPVEPAPRLSGPPRNYINVI
jgi:hypothetical protein